MPIMANIHVLREGISLHVRQGELVALIDAKGAGWKNWSQLAIDKEDRSVDLHL